MLDPELIEAQNAYRRPLSIKGENALVEKLVDTNWDEHQVRKGDPSKPTYYIIRRKWAGGGILSYFNSVAGQIRYAMQKDWIPVVDMQNYPNIFFKSSELGKENAWEYFFEQPLRIGLAKAYSGENIILSSTDRMYPPYSRSQYYNNGIQLAEWRMLVKLGLLKIKPALMEEILAVHEKLFAPTDRVLGVRLRGTDYAANKPSYHPIQPPVEYARDVIIQKVREWKCNKIFLATEDKSIVEFFKHTFGDGFGTFCVTLDREYADYKPGKWINDVSLYRETDLVSMTKAYITEMIILSKCNSFVTAMNNGAWAAMMFSEGFKNVYAFELGRYGVRPVDWRKLTGQ